jgi:hypothetical protein
MDILWENIRYSSISLIGHVVSQESTARLAGINGLSELDSQRVYPMGHLLKLVVLSIISNLYHKQLCKRSKRWSRNGWVWVEGWKVE